MNILSILITLHVALLCIGLGMARPAGSSQGRNNRDKDSANKRSRPSRRLRMLQKMLRRLSVNDVVETMRSKKNRKSFSSHSRGRERYTQPSTPSLPRPEEVDCPRAVDGVELFACPTPDEFGYYQCIDDHALCDKKRHCPNGEDEDGTVCMFHKVTMNNFRILMEAIFGLTRSVV